jgi:hypothetical protein
MVEAIEKGDPKMVAKIMHDDQIRKVKELK